MRNLILSIVVLFSVCAFASEVFAQPLPLCPLGQAHRTDCNPDRDLWRAQQRARADAYRAQEARQLAYKESRRYWLEGPAADVRCGIDPIARFCTYHGRQLGWSWDDWSWGRGSITLFGFGHYSYDPDFAGETYWVIPYKLHGTSCPATGPADTAAPHGYQWHCEHGVDSNYGAYVKKRGKRVLRDYAQRGIVDDQAIVVGPKTEGAS